MNPQYQFGPIHVHISSRQVWREHQRVELGDRAFDLLVLLIEQRHRVVHKDEMLRTVWRDRAVEDGNLHVQVATLRRCLGPEVIATVHGQGYRFAAAVRQIAGNPATPAPAAPPRDRLHTPLLGREVLLRELGDALASHRLLTLVGPGGVGKTRLARALADAPPANWRDGICWCELAEVLEPQGVAAALAQALGLPLSDLGAADLAERLQPLHALLVLDNAEHLLKEVAGLVDRLIALAPGVTVLVTSRERLGHPLERAVDVPGLAVPASAEAAGARDTAALALFERCVQATGLKLAWTAPTVADAVEICAQFEGLPLAIELAAARVPLLGVRGVRDHLGDRLHALQGRDPNAPPRHRSLQQTLEWSYGLLDADEQAALRALGTMVGNFTLDEVVQLIQSPDEDRWAPVERFEALVRKSLVATDPAEPLRWRLLHTTRLYAQQQLELHGETDAACERHARTYADLFARLDDAWLEGPTPEIELDHRAAQALGQLCAALDWACASPARCELAARLLAHGARTLYLHGLRPRGAAWATATAQAQPMTLEPRLRARLWLAWLRIPPASHTREHELLQLAAQTVDALATLGEHARLQIALVHAARHAARAGTEARAREHLQAAVRHQRATDPPRLRASQLAAQMTRAMYNGVGKAPGNVLLQEMLVDLDSAGDGQSRHAYLLRIMLGERLLHEGRHAEARVALKDVCDRCQTDGRGRQSALFAPYDSLVLAEIRCGDLQAARQSALLAIQAGRYADQWCQAASSLAWLLACQGRHRQAAELLAATATFLRATGREAESLEALAIREAQAALESACDPADLARWRERGEGLGPDGLRQMLGRDDPRYMP